MTRPALQISRSAFLVAAGSRARSMRSAAWCAGTMAASRLSAAWSAANAAV